MTTRDFLMIVTPAGSVLSNDLTPRTPKIDATIQANSQFIDADYRDFGRMDHTCTLGDRFLSVRFPGFMLTSSVFQDKRILFACNRPFNNDVQLIARECKSALGTDVASRPLQRSVSSRARLPPSRSGYGIEMTMVQPTQSVPLQSMFHRDVSDNESEETLSPLEEFKSEVSISMTDKPSEINIEKAIPRDGDTVSPIMIDRVSVVGTNESQTSSVTQPALSERVTIPFKTHEKRSMQHVVLRDYVFCVGDSLFR